MEPLSDQATTTGGWSAIVLVLAVLVSVLFGSGVAFGGVVEEPGRLVLDRVPKPALRLGGPVGDYYRTGLAGQEFYRTPRPRWESLHAIQGLVELYRITGDAQR